MNIRFWDTKAPHKYQKLPLFFNKSHGMVFVYSCIDRDSFDKINSWITDLKEKGRDDIEYVRFTN